VLSEAVAVAARRYTVYLTNLGTRRELQILAAFVIFTHLPFLAHPIQGDDLYYLYGAQHAQIDPLHPHHARYVFQGREVSMQGHPHPPLNAWILGGLLALRGDIDESVFHLGYLALSVGCAMAMYALARKFVPDQSLLASLLFLATPAFWVSGNSLESDLPFLACWLAGIALWVHGRIWLAALPLLLSGLAAYQAVALIPILWLYRRHALAVTPALGLIGYQVFERATSGVWPVLATANYFSEYGLQRPLAKLLNAAAMTAHLAWTAGPMALFQPHWALASALPAAALDWNPLFWISFAIGVVVLIKVDGFLGWWIRLFFAAALILFFAGSARYLLPIAPAVCLWAAKRLNEERLTYAIGAQMALAGVLTLANYQHWQAYKDFIDTHVVPLTAQSKRVWVAGEWGLRYYAEQAGALPLKQGQILQAGEQVLISRYGQAPPSGTLQPVVTEDIRPSLPLRLIGGRAGWSTVAFGVRPFDVSLEPVDRLVLAAVVDRPPTLSQLPMNHPEAERQLLSGFYPLEENRYRWMGPMARVVLVSQPAPVTLTVFATEEREFTVSADGRELQRFVLKQGLQTLATPAFTPTSASTVITLQVDRPVKAPGDTRELGVIIQSIGFRQ
jgi:hypothetical protein